MCLRSVPCNSAGNDETQYWKAYYTTHDEDYEEDFDLYCLYNSMFTKEEIELQWRQDLLKTIFRVWRQASTPSEASDQDYKAGWVWEGDPFTCDWVWSETGEWPEWPPEPTQTTQEDQETEEDPDIAEFLQIWTGV
jgi:hypothetical protein